MPARSVSSRIVRPTLDAMLPHTGRALVLDCVDSWDNERILCQTWSHLCPDNPLRRQGVLSSAVAIEYGAQALGLLGALQIGGQAKAGMVVAARKLQRQIDRLDGYFQPLYIAAQILAEDSRSARGAFSMATSTRTLVSGEVTIAFLQADPRSASTQPS